MDWLDNRWNMVGRLIFGSQDGEPLPEPTVAPFNPHPVDVDMSPKPLGTVKLIPIDKILVRPPPEIQAILNEIFQSSESTTPSEASTQVTENLGNSAHESARKALGKAVEVVHEITTEHPSTTNPITSYTVATSNGKVTYDPSRVNIYVIAALSLIIIILFCFGVLTWCKKNKLKAEKRNAYPVFAVTNSQYMDPKEVNNEKIKNVP